MARIYQAESYGDNFAGSLQSRGFNPVAAVDRSQQEREKAKQAVANVDREIQILGRDQQLERTVLAAQQTGERARLQSQQAAIKGLLSLSQTAIKTAQFVEETNLQIEQENQLLDSIGFTENGFEPQKVPFNEGKDLDTAINAEATAIDQTATEVEAGGTLEDKDVGHQLRQGSAHNIAAGVKGNIYNARGAHKVFMQEALRQIPDDQKPRTLPEAQALIRSLNRQFFRLSGLSGVNRKLLLKDLAPTIAANTQAIEAQLLNAAIQADQKANLTKLNSSIYSAVASDMSAEEVWKVASEGFAHGNVGHQGFSAASNEQAMKAIIASAVNDGDVALIEDLADTPKMANQPNGPKLGDDFAHLLGPALTQAREKRNAAIRAQKTAIAQQAETAIQNYYDNPSGEAKAQLIETLQALPQTTTVRNSLSNLTQKGFNNDPALEAELAAAAARGEFIPQDVLKDHLDAGRIRPEVYNQHALTQVDIKTNKAAAEFSKELKPFIEDAILNSSPTPSRVADMPKTTRVVYGNRVKMFQDELTKALAAEARDNPKILNNLQERNKLAQRLMGEIAKRPEFTLINDAKTGIQFAADPGQRSDGLEAITIAPGEQDFRRYSYNSIINNVPLSEINATDDLILKETTLELDVKNILAGDKVSPTTRSYARKLGMSERAFINAQLQRYGKPPLGLLENSTAGEFRPKRATPGTDLNATTGFRHLQSMGFPTRGAAYITSAISHESSWHGMREWPEVAGDGTNRNGGLISWASWHNNSARLGAIERHFGRSISQINETDQLQYMKHEMKTRYPKAYRIFTNPSASSADLRWAVSNYWGFDPKYTGNRWVDAEALINRS